MSIGQMLFIRGLFAVAVFSLAMRVTGRPVISQAARSKWVVVRAFCECGITICFVTGLSLLPIATASTLVWTSPIFLAVVAAMILKEHVTIMRWLAIFIGFAGVVLITNPASAEFSPAMLLPLAAAALVSIRDLGNAAAGHQTALNIRHVDNSCRSHDSRVVNFLSRLEACRSYPSHVVGSKRYTLKLSVFLSNQGGATWRTLFCCTVLVHGHCGSCLLRYCRLV